LKLRAEKRGIATPEIPLPDLLLQTGWVKTIGNGKGRRYRAV